MKKIFLIAGLIASSMFSAFAGSALFYTNFSDNSTITTTGDLTNSKLTGNGDYENWLTATTYCFFEGAGTLTLPSLTFVGGETITVKWGTHDGRTISLLDGSTLLTTWQAISDVASESTFTFATDFTGAKTLTLEISDATLAITEIAINSGGTVAVSNVAKATAKVQAWGKTIKVQGEAGELLEVMDLAGNTVYRSVLKSDVQSLDLNISGFYLVKVGEELTKVIVE